MTKKYDLVARKYDLLFSDKDSIKENLEVKKMLKKYFGSFKNKSILDVGCGTGLLIDLLKKEINLKKYIGIDPSIEMLREFYNKHPNYIANLYDVSFEEFKPQKFDFVISLFASCSYVNPKQFDILLKKSLKKDGKFFIMFFKENYYPVTYKKSKIEMKHFNMSNFKLNGYIKEFNNFIIYTNEIL